MKNWRGVSLKRAAGLGALSAIGMMLLGAAPAFAWHVVLPPGCSSSSQVQPCFTTSASITPTVHDSATIQISNNGPTAGYTCPDSSSCPFGYITFKVYTVVVGQSCRDGSGNPTGTLKFTSFTPVTASAQAGPTTYQSASVALAPGSYNWVATYSGTGSGGYPSAMAACEPFTIVTNGVPEFPSGMALLLAIALPAMLLLRGKFVKI